jgi:hypothetical protein
MKATDLIKAVPIAVLALGVYSTGAVAGATNRDENTAATPGDKSTSVNTPADAANPTDTAQPHDKTLKNKSWKNKSGSGSSGGTGSKYENSKQGNSSAEPGAGSTPENADSGYDAATGNTSGSSTGAAPQ